MKILFDIGIVLVLACYLFFIGYFATRKMEALFLEEAARKQEKTKEGCDVVIFGNSRLAGRCEIYLKTKEVRCCRIKKVDPDFAQRAKRENYIFALDDSDYQNLVVCGMLKGFHHSEYLYAVCNEPENRKLFLENKIVLLDKVSISAETLYRIVKENQHAS